VKGLKCVNMAPGRGNRQDLENRKIKITV